jgi:hypothetical protein
MSTNSRTRAFTPLFCAWSSWLTRYWTAERLRLKAWLTRDALSLAELYEGAVSLLGETRLPGYTRFVGHALREIGDRLPFAEARTGDSDEAKEFRLEVHEGRVGSHFMRDV